MTLELFFILFTFGIVYISFLIILGFTLSQKFKCLIGNHSVYGQELAIGIQSAGANLMEATPKSHRLFYCRKCGRMFLKEKE